MKLAGSREVIRLGDRPGSARGEAALTEPWSNGQTEGQNTKLKLVKRQMYGIMAQTHHAVDDELLSGR